ncbi:SNAP receptor [Microsporum canis]|uniref:Syntaxin n=1 Tax=Arthroderma otae (strain ATCC MYA-4605 / CBS 113480) TaxID=554155 RepID=C5FF14_ARTOC|nr:syntaxin [Microsporum canis CBS 113480]EEQ28308.1 syntaxin [Microsporum canis CBS 113480]
MSFDRLSSLEAQPSGRRQADSQYHDDPEFQRLTEFLSNKLFTLTSNITRLSSQISLLGTKRDTDRARERVHNLLEETREGFREAGEGVKKIQNWEDVTPAQKWTQDNLSSKFKSTLDEFQAVQRRALEKQRASTAAARTAIEEATAHTGPEGEETQGLQQLQEQPRLASQDDVDFQEALIIERETEIRNIEQSVGELNELFRDVGHIVREQGGQIDIISENVHNTRDDTRGAERELRTASRHQKNARNKMCCLLVIMAIILVIIVLAVVLG